MKAGSKHRAHHANAACSNEVFVQLKITIGTVRASLPPSPTVKHWFLGVLPGAFQIKLVIGSL